MIRAKPTLYDGIRFRSRLEARWATFMDALGPRFWVYEPEVPGGYQPDFEIGHAYIEVKPLAWLEGSDNDRGYDLLRWENFVTQVGKSLFVFIGPPGEWENGKLTETTRVLMLIYVVEDGGFRVAMGQWGECPTCGSVKVIEDGRAICDCPPVFGQITSALHAVRDASYVDAR